MSLSNIFIDTETLPTRRPDVLADFLGEANAKRDKALAEIAPPSNWKDADKIADWHATTGEKQRITAINEAAAAYDETMRKTSFDGGFGHLAVVSIAVNDEEPIALYDEGWDADGYEEWLLNETNKRLAEIAGHQSGHRMIGHNIGFDRRFLRQRGMVLGVRMHNLLTREVKPWEGEVICDTQYMWTGDARSYITLDKLCRIFGRPGKGELDGSKVYDWIIAGRIAEVAGYCNNDVDDTRYVFKRMSYAPNALRIAA